MQPAQDIIAHVSVYRSIWPSLSDMVIDRDHMARIIADWARSEPVIRKAFLYGSVARNEWKPGSDIDVAIQLVVDVRRLDTRPS